MYERGFPETSFVHLRFVCELPYNSLTIWKTEMNAINACMQRRLTWVMQGAEHDTQSGKVLKGSDALNTSIK